MKEILTEGLTNPTAMRIIGAVNRSRAKQLRGIFDLNGNTHWWDAYDMTHDQGAKQLGIPYDYKRRLFATMREDGVIIIDHDDEQYTKWLKPLVTSAVHVGDDIQFTGWRGTWTPDDFLEQLEEYEQDQAVLQEALSDEEEKLVDALEDWMSHYDKGDAYTGDSNPECDRIIELSKNFKPRYNGMLYRGTAIFDEYGEALARGETVTVPPLPKKLASWSKDTFNALQFAEDAASENHTAVVIAMNTDQLDLVVDLDILYDNRPETGHESEIIAFSQPLVLSKKNVLHLWVYDHEAQESVQIF